VESFVVRGVSGRFRADCGVWGRKIRHIARVDRGSTDRNKFFSSN